MRPLLPLLVAILFLLTACGSGDAPPPATGGGPESPTDQAGGGEVKPIVVEPGSGVDTPPPPPPPPADPALKFQQTVERKRKSVDPEERMGAVEMLLESKDKSFAGKILVILLADESEDVRALAAEAVGLIEYAGGATALTNVARMDKDSLVRGKALKSLTEVSGKAAVPELIRALAGDDEGTVRAQAGNLLGILETELATDPLIKALKEDFDSAVRIAALGALKKTRPQRALDTIIESLEDMNTEVRGQAAVTLGEYGNKKAVGPLIRAMDDEDVSRIQLYITDALAKLTGEENEFDVDASEEDQEEALQIWRDWWVENQGKY
jgi:HEAT repeat protein